MRDAGGLRRDAGSDRLERVAVPGAVVDHFLEPDSIEAAREIIEEAGRAGRSLLIAGGGTRLHWANPARPLAFGLSTRGLHGIDELEPEEGVLHAAAGTPVAEVRAAARAEGWELPLDAPGAGSTIGGVIATAVQGPRANAFGRVSDAVLGLDVVGADGVPSRCGGRVVKNVTGYDLAKLYCGSFGSLALITGAWLRLRPRPAVQRAFTAEIPARAAELEACRALASRGSVRAMVWSAGGRGADGDEARLHVELGGHEAEVDHDRALLAERFALEEVACERIDALRDARAEGQEGTVALRARVPGDRCAELVDEARAAGLRVEVEPALGVLHGRGRLESAAALRSLRERAEALGGVATVERMPASWSGELDVFGDAGAARALMAGIKRRFDPQDLFNPGRYVSGL